MPLPGQSAVYPLGKDWSLDPSRSSCYIPIRGGVKGIALDSEVKSDACLRWKGKEKSQVFCSCSRPHYRSERKWLAKSKSSSSYLVQKFFIAAAGKSPATVSSLSTYHLITAGSSSNNSFNWLQWNILRTQ